MYRSREDRLLRTGISSACVFIPCLGLYPVVAEWSLVYLGRYPPANGRVNLDRWYVC